MKFLGITFDSKLTFQKHFEEILGRCNTRYHRVRLIVNKKWGPSPSTILQIYKQCVRSVFEYGSLSAITTSDTIISKIHRLHILSAYIYIHTHTNIANQSNSRKCQVDLIHISNLKPLGPSFFSRDPFICSHTYFWGSICDRN